MAVIKSDDRRRALVHNFAQRRILTSERQFRRACDQIVLMNGLLKETTIRYKRAKVESLRSFRYPQRLRLAVIEGVRNMFYDYAQQKADEIEQLRYLVNVSPDDVEIEFDVTDGEEEDGYGSA